MLVVLGFRKVVSIGVIVVVSENFGGALGGRGYFRYSEENIFRR